MKSGRPPVLAIGLVAATIAFSSDAFAHQAGYYTRAVVDWKTFSFGIATLTFVYFFLAYVLGRQVLGGKLDVRYSRKILQPVCFLFPMVLSIHVSPLYILAKPFSIDPFPWIEKPLLVMALTGTIVFLWTFAFVKPLRNRIRFLSTAFTAIDPDEDNGFTLRWLRIEITVIYIISLIYLYCGFSNEFMNPETSRLIFVPFFVSIVGDTLATIVGTRYGRKSYKVKALLTGKTQTRILEGSLCIFLSAAFIITSLYFTSSYFLHHQAYYYIYPWKRIDYITHYAGMMIFVPLSMTIAEAKSPPNWGNFSILLSGFVSILVSCELVDAMNRLASFFINNW